MAPRKKNRRLDAALENMALMGFSEKVVTQKVDELLKVYEDHDQGWRAIEENAYLLLIEVLLDEKQNDDSEKKDTSLGDGNRCREEIETSLAGPPAVTNESFSLSNDSAFQIRFPGAEAERGTRNMDMISGRRNVDFIAGRIVKDSGPDKYQQNNLSSSSKQVDGVSTKMRRPCYGWLSEDEDDDHGELLTERSEKFLVIWNGKKKRKRR